MSDRNPKDLDFHFVDRALAVIAGCKARGIDLLVTCTRRSLAEQAQLYAQGRTVPGHIVTHAQPGQSAHNYGLAMDCYPMYHGKPDLAGQYTDGWRIYAEEIAKQKLEWAGNWQHFKEMPHCQLPNWQDIAQRTVKTA